MTDDICILIAASTYDNPYITEPAREGDPYCVDGRMDASGNWPRYNGILTATDAARINDMRDRLRAGENPEIVLAEI